MTSPGIHKNPISLRYVRNWNGRYGVASGTNTYTLTLSPALEAYTAGQTIAVKFTNANTGASTININGLGAKNITKSGATALASGNIAAGQIYLLTYDGTQFQINVGGGGSLNGSGTTNYVPKFTASTTIGDSIISNLGSAIQIDGTDGTAKLYVKQTNNLYAGIKVESVDANDVGLYIIGTHNENGIFIESDSIINGIYILPSTATGGGYLVNADGTGALDTNTGGFNFIADGANQITQTSNSSETQGYGLYIYRSSGIVGNTSPVLLIEDSDAGSGAPTLQVANLHGAELLQVSGSTGNIGIRVDEGTAYLHIKGGSSNANSASLKLGLATNLLTTPETGAVEYYNGWYLTKNDALRMALGGIINKNTTSTGNSAGSETTLATYTLPANALKNDGDSIEVTAFGTFAANANTKTLKSLFGTNTLQTVSSGINGSDWFVTIKIIRSASTTVQCGVQMVNTTLSQSNYTSQTVTLSNTNAIEIKGNGTDASDVVFKGWTVRIDSTNA